jgi:hypothetical protein
MSASSRVGAKLEFISVSHPDEVKNRHNKRKIHQHVMKDIGLSRRKNMQSRTLRSESNISKTLALHETHSAYTLYQPDNCKPEKISQSSTRPLDPGADRTLYSRTDMRAKMMEAFRKSYLSLNYKYQISQKTVLRPKSSICDKVREICFAIGLVDDATLNLALAEIALYSNGYTGDMHSGREDSAALKHYNHCLRLTSQKIQTANNMTSDEVLITVIGLANYDVIFGI